MPRHIVPDKFRGHAPPQNVRHKPSFQQFLHTGSAAAHEAATDLHYDEHWGDGWIEHMTGKREGEAMRLSLPRDSDDQVGETPADATDPAEGDATAFAGVSAQVERVVRVR